MSIEKRKVPNVILGQLVYSKDNDISLCSWCRSPKRWFYVNVTFWFKKRFWGGKLESNIEASKQLIFSPPSHFRWTPSKDVPLKHLNCGWSTVERLKPTRSCTFKLVSLAIFPWTTNVLTLRYRGDHTCWTRLGKRCWNTTAGPCLFWCQNRFRALIRAAKRSKERTVSAYGRAQAKGWHFYRLRPQLVDAKKNKQRNDRCRT